MGKKFSMGLLSACLKPFRITCNTEEGFFSNSYKIRNISEFYTTPPDISGLYHISGLYRDCNKGLSWMTIFVDD